MELGSLLLAIVAGTSLISWFAAWCLARRNWRVRTSRAMLGGLLPMFVIIAVLAVEHVEWLWSKGKPQHETYSPLIAFIYGFWMVPIILASNFLASFLGSRGK